MSRIQLTIFQKSNTKKTNRYKKEKLKTTNK